jgi:hypothetical protein
MMPICTEYVPITDKPHDPAPLSRADLANEAARRYTWTDDPFYRAVADALRTTEENAT